MKKVMIFLISLSVLWSSVFAGFEHTIVDVTKWKEIRGITTPSDANGYALVSYDDEFSLNAEFFGLSDPLNDDFYEWWLVRRDPFAFISTGVADKRGDTYRNAFTSTTDYSAYDFYVLTLEPNDGDPAPADHIIEWEVVMQKSEESMMTIQSTENDEMMKTVTIDLTGKNFEFSQNEIRVNKGDTVTINFESTGWFHDWVVDEFDVATDRVNPGTMTSVTFVANEVWTFEYYCSVGSHREQGMVGRLIVEDTMMKDDSMMKKEMTPRQLILKIAIESKLATLDVDMNVLLERVISFRDGLDSRNLTASKKAAYMELLDVLIIVLKEKTMMGGTMMDK